MSYSNIKLDFKQTAVQRDYAEVKFLMKIEDIHAFIAFVKLQSTSLTAQQLGITQPAVTRRIQSLEQACSVQLFDRNTRPLKLTAKGREIYEQCCIIEQEFNRLKQIIALQSADSTHLRIGIPNSLSESGIFGMIQDLQKDFPSAKIEISTGWGKELLSKLAHDELDGVISTAKEHNAFPKDYSLKIMGTLHIRPVVAKSLSRSGVSTWEDLQDLGWILNNKGCGFREFLTEQLEKQYKQLNLKIEVTGTRIQLDLIQQGVGAGFLAQELIFQTPHFHQLSIIDTGELNLDVIVYNARRENLSHAQTELFDVIMERFNQKLHLT
ncbi:MULTISPECIES: LysR family transcriptional regulator [unclassified Acinetobacter]|uniref:LysR family transcriptional regulator n=1 Tax=unclassified Acinetobacter TaxID=196816 RepID=UPI0015D3EF60|nr:MULTISPECIES: LysR family transcriptional regulator [unclassified Acinetobacter]UUS59085.1 LysR family transcriptional regulator [Acinetobacter sp. YH16040_T]